MSATKNTRKTTTKTMPPVLVENITDLPPVALRAPQAAAYVGVPATTLKRWRVEGRGPRHIKLEGAIVAYRVDDLNSWVRGAA